MVIEFFRSSVVPLDNGFWWCPYGGDYTVQIIRDELTGRISAGWWHNGRPPC